MRLWTSVGPVVEQGRRPWLTVAVLCAAVYLINASTTLMNVTLPTLVEELSADTRQLQWIVDGFNLTFAAFVLAAGSLSDRFGRRRALVVGLVVFGIAAAVGAASDTPRGLIAWRAVMGVGAAIIFPTTLTIISNLFPNRRERAQAIGLWGATAGIAIATGPIGGGLLLDRFWWGSTMLALAPIAGAVLVAALVAVPESRDPDAPRMDWPGLALSTAMLGALVFTIIEAPEAGWGSVRTLGGFALTAALLAAFVAVERRAAPPMLDVRLFRNMRFTAASGSVTLAFFGLFGFIFLATQYFQFLKGYSALESGVRLLPVAFAVATSSLLGTKLAVAIGTRSVVATGLVFLGSAFVWISRVDIATSYPEIVGQMILLGVGLGLSSAPATEAIMGVVPREKAGVGSAINDATRELGGTLGVAVIGSVFASLYRDRLADAARLPLPGEALAAARESIGSALFATGELTAAGQPDLAAKLAAIARDGFLDGWAAGCLVAAGVCFAGAVVAGLALPAQPLPDPADLPIDEPDAWAEPAAA